jgi:hypothetical protein
MRTTAGILRWALDHTFRIPSQLPRRRPKIGAKLFHKLVIHQPARKFSLLPQKPQKPTIRVEKATADDPQTRRRLEINRSLPI